MLAALTFSCSDAPVLAENPKVPSYAISPYLNTSLGAAMAPLVESHPGLSGFRLLTTGTESFAMRLALIEAAEKSLDLQYYSIHDDTTANLLLAALLRAAKRGVRIRFLLDDISRSEVDRTFSVLDGVSNIEIRIFNPFSTRQDGMFGRITRLITDTDLVNRRMHNKALIADNQLAIIGGRNLGDEYFEANTDVAFRDLDILSAGPVTQGISRSFDAYWNSDSAEPIGRLKKPPQTKEEKQRVLQEIDEHWQSTLGTAKGRELLKSPFAARLKEGSVPLLWAKAELLADSPKKIEQEREETNSRPMQRMDVLLEHAQKEFIAVSPYFVPRDDGVEWLASLVARGMHVVIITNSLASTDVVAVHTGYKPYRKLLLEKGVEIYEMKPTGGKRPKQRLIGRKSPAQASLHAKVYVIDRKDVIIGSFNLDPRSEEINTEIAMLIHSPELAAQVLRIVEEVTSPDDSYKLSLSDNQSLVWEGNEDGEPVKRTIEPQAGVWRRVEMYLLQLLPLEGHL